MSKKTPADYVRDMLREIDDVAAFASEGKAAFMADSRTRKAIIRSYEVIGEIAKRLPDDLRSATPQVRWPTLIGFRDFLAHHYEEVILENIWDAVQDLPDLRSAVEAMLAGLEEPGDEA